MLAFPLKSQKLVQVFLNPVSLRIITELVIGKLLGIAGFVGIAVRLGICILPSNLDMNHIIGVRFLGGIGYILSRFIAELGFSHSPEDLLLTKMRILVASTIRGLSDFIEISFYNNNKAQTK